MESKKRSNGWVPAATALGGALVVFSGCGHTASDPAKGEVTDRASSADAPALGSADQPNSCGSYMGDADFFPVAGMPGAVRPAQFSGRITADSPAQDGALGPPGTLQGAFNAHSCDTPNPTPTVIDQAGDNHYNEIFLKNWTDADACISVRGDHQIHDASARWSIGAYVGAFDPTDILKNNVGSGGGGVVHFSFKVPAHAAFELVVMAESPHDPDGNLYAPVDVLWGVEVANCGQPGDVGSSSGGSSSGDMSSGGMSSSGGSSSGGSTSGGDTDAGAPPPPPPTDDAGTGGKSW